VANGRCLNPFKEYSTWVTSLSLSGDGQLALSGSYREARLWEVASGRCLHTLEGHEATVSRVSLSADGQIALLAGYAGNLIQVWMLDWELDVPTSVSWDEKAHPFLETFLTLHTPFAAALPSDHEPTEEERQLALTRRGRPTWTEDDFEGFIRQLQCCGYGWLQPEEVRKRLEQIASAWWKPPTLPGA